jgi:hypothetical protein
MTLPGLAHAPRPLLIVGTIALGVAVGLLLLMLWHVLRRLLNIPRVPLWGGTYVMMFITALLLSATGLMAFAIGDALIDWPAVGDGPVAEVRCQPATGGGTELRLVPLPTRTPETRVPVTGSCTMRATLLRFAAPIEGLGIGARYQIDVTSAVRPTTVTPGWRALPQPLGLPVATTRTETLLMATDAGALWRVTAGETALHLERAK